MKSPEAETKESARIRREIATAAMQGLIINSSHVDAAAAHANLTHLPIVRLVAVAAVGYADALIAALNQENKS